MDAQTFIATRNRLGLSQAAIATSLGVDQATVSRWEAGKTRIPTAITFVVCWFFGFRRG